MPHTYNGIGTWYYGKKNLQTRPGVCEFCHREATLSSYDTRLWVVILFIPVIPISRKHILNACPKCRRHRVISLAEWEKIKGKNLSDATAAMQANPQDPQAAIKLHSSLVAFGQVAAADKLAALMQERFANDAAALAYLGSSLQFHGRAAEALPFYQQALKLNPDLPEPRVFFALDLLKKGQLDEAHQLLKFLEAPAAPGAAQYPGALFALASAYQQAGRQKEALPLFDLLIERFPKFAQDKKFRAAFKQAETAAGRDASRLPARQIRWKPILGVGAVLALVLIAALISNYYISQHQMLYLVSGASRPVTVQIAGRPNETLHPGGTAVMQLPEGAYHAVLSGAIQSQMDIRISSSFWDRWFKKPVNILNAGGTALLVLENTTYATRHDINSDAGRGFSFYFGQPFLALPNVDYPFQAFPASITVDSQSSSTIQKSRIDLFEGTAENAFLALATKSRYGEAFPLAEWSLNLRPDDNELLTYYVYFGNLTGRAYGCRAFLAQGARRRPVEIAWHRAYQESYMHGKDALPLIAEYDSLLKSEPDNSALQYLRGRLSASRREADSFYERAIALDPKNAFAHYAFAGDQLAGADWTNALLHFTEAVRLQPAESQFQQTLFLSQLAAGKLAEAEAFARDAAARNPLDYFDTMRLGTLFVLQNKTNELEKLTASYQRKIESVEGPQGAETIAGLRAVFLYAAGDFAGMEKLPRIRNTRTQPGRFSMLVELGRLQEAADLLKMARVTPDEWVDLLALSAAWKQAGNDAEAASCLDQAIQLLSNNRLEDIPIAEILKRGQPASLDEIMDIPGVPIEKAMLLVVQAQRFPRDNAALLAAARRLNFAPQFPYHLINRLAVRLSGSPP